MPTCHTGLPHPPAPSPHIGLRHNRPRPCGRPTAGISIRAHAAAGRATRSERAQLSVASPTIAWGGEHKNEVIETDESIGVLRLESDGAHDSCMTHIYLHFTYCTSTSTVNTYMYSCTSTVNTRARLSASLPPRHGGRGENHGRSLRYGTGGPAT